MLKCLGNHQRGLPRNIPSPAPKDGSSLAVKVAGRENFDFTSHAQWKKSIKTDDLLHCPAGSKVSFSYRPNGHVTKDLCVGDDPRCKAPVSNNQHPQTFWSVHWNEDNHEALNFYNDLTDENTVPDSRSPFDDGTCGEADISCPEEDTACKEYLLHRKKRDCVGIFTIPWDAVQGETQFVWHWQLDQDPQGSGEEYFTAFDIVITDSGEEMTPRKKRGTATKTTTAVKDEKDEL